MIFPGAAVEYGCHLPPIVVSEARTEEEQQKRPKGQSARGGYVAAVHGEPSGFSGRRKLGA